MISISSILFLGLSLLSKLSTNTIGYIASDARGGYTVVCRPSVLLNEPIREMMMNELLMTVALKGSINDGTCRRIPRALSPSTARVYIPDISERKRERERRRKKRLRERERKRILAVGASDRVHLSLQRSSTATI